MLELDFELILHPQLEEPMGFEDFCVLVDLIITTDPDEVRGMVDTLS